MSDIAEHRTEASLLSSIFASDNPAEVLGGVSDYLTAPRAQWFDRREHKIIAWALDAAAEGKATADGLGVMDWLSAQPADAARDMLLGRRIPHAGYQPAEPGDTADHELRGYLPDATVVTATTKTLRAWAERLRRLGDARQAQALVEGLAKAIMTAPLDLASAVGPAVGKLHQLALGGVVEQDMGSALRHILTSEQPVSRSQARWGYAPMDAAEDGVHFVRGEVTVLAAPSGGGKTSLALQAVAATASELGPESVAIASLEMPTATLASIIAGRQVGIPPRWIRDKDGRIDGPTLDALHTLADTWQQSRSMLCRDNTVGPDARSLDAILGWIRYRAMASTGKLQLAVIDHMHLIQRPAKASAIDWIEQCSGQIKACAAALNIPILVLAQMTKEGAKAIKDSKSGKVTGTPEPVLQDLRGAAALGNDAAQVIFVHDEQAGMDHQDDSRQVRILVRKNRYGRTCGFDAVFHAPMQAFVSPAAHTEPRNTKDEARRMADAESAATDWTA